jgi:mannose-6-phosphate isomerase
MLHYVSGVMTIERAVFRAVPKPWGRTGYLPWSNAKPGGIIGEICFERPGLPPTDTSLLLKLLFTRQPLSIQVHPDDAMAHTMGLPRGKAEAWYVLSATPGAKVAVGVRETTTPGALSASIANGSIQSLVCWRTVQAHDVIAIPAGTIHALGAGLVVAELQQRSDTTFRLFDFGRERTLQVDLAVAAAKYEPTQARPPARRLTEARVLLVACPQFVFERIELRTGSRWQIEAAAETWLLVIDGAATIGTVHAVIGETVFLDQHRALVTPGPTGMTALVGVAASAPADNFLSDVTSHHSIEA